MQGVAGGQRWLRWNFRHKPTQGMGAEARKGSRGPHRLSSLRKLEGQGILLTRDCNNPAFGKPRFCPQNSKFTEKN
eukprot:2492722-Amphidinium_carterae.1